MSLKRDIGAAAFAAAGSKGSKAARVGHVSRFADFLKSQNVRIERLENVKAKHIKAFAAARLAEGVEKRTLQNELGSIRTALRQAGRFQLAGLAEICNKALGAGGASRAGTKTAISPDRTLELLKGVTEGVHVCVFLQEGVGLRAEEARQANMETLKRWEKNLVSGEPLMVIRGTKGGLKRYVLPFDKGKALDAVREALRVASANSKGVLIPGTLKQAATKYRNEMHRAGFKGKESGHSLRYAFARAQFSGYLAAGLSCADALSAVSTDLGHGDGRGRYISQVYLR